MSACSRIMPRRYRRHGPGSVGEVAAEGCGTVDVRKEWRTP